VSEDSKWDDLRAPFDPAEVDFRIQSTYERNGKTQAVVVAYVDARAVQDRLDKVVGPANWSFDWTPLIQTNTAITAAKGTLTICGVSKSDVGDAGQTEPTKASVSDCFKRAAVQWGIARYIYALPVMFATLEKRGNSWILPDAEERRLRAQLGGGQTRQQPEREYKAEGAADPATSDEEVYVEAGVEEPTVPTGVGSKAYWEAQATKEQQLAVVTMLRSKGYKTREAVATYLNQLTKSKRFDMDSVVPLSAGDAEWMTRALSQKATDDLKKRKDVAKSA
jgi:hypothetical protein